MNWPIAAFGDVGFWIVMADSDLLTLGDWAQESRIAEYPVPGSDRVVVQTLGRGRYKVSWPIELESLADLRALRALVFSTGTLRIPSGIQGILANEVIYMGVVYDELSDVTLDSIDAVQINTVQGWVRATVTFSRSAT